MAGHTVSPHPDPLPQGEGTTRLAQWKARGSGLFSAERRVDPLPKGEGWGEGKEPTAPRGADVLALAYGQSPQRSLTSSHSRFKASGFGGTRCRDAGRRSPAKIPCLEVDESW